MWNRHYLDIYSFPARPHRARAWRSRRWCSFSAELGNHPDQTPQQFLAAYKKELRNNRGGARAKSRELLRGGRTIETAHVYSPGLGWVVTHEDVTEEIASDRDRPEAQARARAAEHPARRGGQQYHARASACSMPRGRLVICNAPYARIYELPDELVKPGTPLDDILGHLFDTRHACRAAPTPRRLHQLAARGDRARRVRQDRRRVRHPHHHDAAPSDEGWRVRLDARGHHRAAPAGSAHPAPGAARRADRAAQPHPVPRGDGGSRGRRSSAARRSRCSASISTTSSRSTTRSATPSATRC